jgi:hypothetical protein
MPPGAEQELLLRRYRAAGLQPRPETADSSKVRSLALIRRARVPAAVLAALSVLGSTPVAHADTSGQANARVRQLLAQVARIQRQVATAESAYDQALAGVANSVTTAIFDGRSSDQIAAQVQSAQDQLDNRVRGLYMSGGPLALYATVLDAQDPMALQDQAIVVGQVVSSDSLLVAAGQQVADEASHIAADAQRQAHARIRTERSVAVVALRIETLLAQEQSLLAQARQHAADVVAAESALAAQQGAFSTITTERIASLRALPAAASYMQLYHSAAAAECPGLSWGVLAAIGQVESGHGRDTSTSYAGAMGPMQFLPSTFRTYAVDGDHNRVADIMDPADAIYSAAHYLCANGAGRGGAALYQAIWHYNHADWYVQMVLALARQYVG